MYQGQYNVTGGGGGGGRGFQPQSCSMYFGIFEFHQKILVPSSIFHIFPSLCYQITKSLVLKTPPELLLSTVYIV